jgi:hypothetical protein
VNTPESSTAFRARTPDAADLVGMWPLSRRLTPSERTAAFLLAVDGPAALQYTLGGRNQRLIALHESLVQKPIEAHAVCPECGTDNEFTLPAQALSGLPPAAPGAVARLDVDGAPRAFRLPVLADLGAASAGLADLAARTCLDPPAPQLTEKDLDRLARAWEALDPAGSLRVELSCAGCGDRIAADADAVDFVARDLERLVDRHMREVDVLAGTYGWSEAAILALPAGRRRRYVELVTESRSPVRRLAAVP